MTNSHSKLPAFYAGGEVDKCVEVIRKIKLKYPEVDLGEFAHFPKGFESRAFMKYHFVIKSNCLCWSPSAEKETEKYQILTI